MPRSRSSIQWPSIALAMPSALLAFLPGSCCSRIQLNLCKPARYPYGLRPARSATFRSGPRALPKEREPVASATQTSDAQVAAETDPSYDAAQGGQRGGFVFLQAVVALSAVGAAVAALRFSENTYFYATRTVSSSAKLGGQRVAEASLDVVTNIPKQYWRPELELSATPVAPPKQPALLELSYDWDLTGQMSNAIDFVFDSGLFNFIIDSPWFADALKQ